MKPAVVCIPVKAFAAAKGRLAGAMGTDERAALAQRMATTVVEAAGDIPVTIVTDADAVRTWAHDLGADVVDDPGGGLNAAVSHAVAILSTRFERVIVAHGDLPLARDLKTVLDGAPVVIVPDRHGDGTNVICLPTSVEFAFAYGPGSFALHLAECRRLGLDVLVRHDPDLGWDVDNPADLDDLPPTVPSGR